jgi:hypothetical protein
VYTFQRVCWGGSVWQIPIQLSWLSRTILLVVCICYFYFAGLFCWQRTAQKRVLGASAGTNQTISLRCFIADHAVRALGETFAGDGRGFSPSESASARVSVAITIEKNHQGANPVIHVVKRYGETKKLDDNGAVMERKTAVSGIDDPQVTRLPNGTAVAINVHTKNPIPPRCITPPVCTAVSIFVARSGIVVVSGYLSEFPSSETNLQIEGSGVVHNMPLWNPGPGASPLRLFKPSHQVFVTGFWPPSPNEQWQAWKIKKTKS